MSEIKQINLTHDFQGSSKVTGLQNATANSDAVNKGQMDSSLAAKQDTIAEGSGIDIDGNEVNVKLSSAGTNYENLTISSANFASLDGTYTRANVGGYVDDGGDNQLDWTEDADFTWYYKDNTGGVWAVLVKRDADGDPAAAGGNWVLALTTNDPTTWSGSQNSAIPDYTAVDHQVLGVSNATDDLSRLAPSSSITEVSYSSGVASGMKFVNNKLALDFAIDVDSPSSTKPYKSSDVKTYIDEQVTEAKDLSNHPFDNSTANIINNPTNANSALEELAAENDAQDTLISNLQTANATQDNYIADNTAALGLSQGDDSFTSWASGTNYDELTLSGMSNSDYNGVYESVGWGYVSGGTFYTDTNDQAIFKQAVGNGNFRVIYSNDSSGFFVNEFDSDPSTWVNAQSVTSVGTSETVSGYATPVNGIYLPDANDANVTYATLSTSFFLLGKTNVRDAVQAASEGAVTVLNVLGTVLGLGQGESDFGTGFTILPDNEDAKTLFQAIEAELQTLASGAGATWAAGVVQSVETSNIADLSNPGTDVFGGETLSQGDVFLLAGQTNKEENGIYTFDTTSTALVRWEDADASADFIQNRSVQIVSDGTEWAYKGVADPVIDTTDLTFEKIRESIIADQAISEAKLTTTLSNKINAKSDKYQETCNLVANEAYFVNHNLGEKYPVISTYGDTDRIEEYSIVAIDTTKFTITSSSNETIVVTAIG